MKAFTKTTEWDWLAVKNVPIKPLEEDLVPINFFPEKIQISPQYFLQKLPGAIPELYLRQGVYEKLITASNDLPSGYKFLIYDAWRDIKTQQALFDILYERHRQHTASRSGKPFIRYERPPPTTTVRREWIRRPHLVIIRTQGMCH